jgi:hypothetical protein
MSDTERVERVARAIRNHIIGMTPEFAAAVARAALAAADQWQAIESAPEGVPLLLWNKHGPFVGEWKSDWVGGLAPSRWRPLPQAPEAK